MTLACAWLPPSGGTPSAQDDSSANQLTSFVRNVLSSSAFQDATSAAYWAYHLGRTAFFVGEVGEALG